MSKMRVSVVADATPEAAFAAMTDLDRAPERIRGIERIEILTDGPVGAGTRFRETRRMFGRETTEEMEITAFEPGSGYTVEADSCGYHCKTDVRCTPVDGGTELSMDIDMHPVTFMAKVMSPLGKLMSGSLRKCLEGDLADIKASLEGRTGDEAQPA